MNDQRTNYGAKDQNSSVQKVRIYTGIAYLVRKNWTFTPSAIGSYSRQEAGRLADETRLDFQILKILYRSNYLDIYFVYSSAILLIVF